MLVPHGLQELVGSGGPGGSADAAASTTTVGAGGGGCGSSWVRDCVDAVCSDALGAYLSLELRWLQGLYAQKLAAHRARGGGLDMAVLLDLLAMNEEVPACPALPSPACPPSPACRPARLPTCLSLECATE